MKTRTEVLEEIRRKADRDISEANLRYDIYDTVLTPEIAAYCVPAVHIHSLWGTIGSIRWEAHRGNTANIPDGNLLRTLIARYAPEPLLYVKGSCASFRPDIQPWDGDITAAHPVIVNVESIKVIDRAAKEVRVMFQWNAYVGDKLMRLCVVCDGSRVSLLNLYRARTTRWNGADTETLWWELGAPVPDFPALIGIRQDPRGSIMEAVLAGI